MSSQPRPLTFTKMHGLGNDFMVINTIQQPFDLGMVSIPALADRHIGVGFDQLLLIEPSTSADFFCRIFNSDGSEAEQCGNGLRCIARYLHEEGIHQGSTLTIETRSGIFPIKINKIDNVTVTLSPPPAADIELRLNPHTELHSLSLGNPHTILKVDSVETAAVATLGPEISTHPHFACGTNVGFMEVVNRDHIRLRTFERGTGETHACGSNACAAAIIGIRNHSLANRVMVEFRLTRLAKIK